MEDRIKHIEENISSIRKHLDQLKTNNQDAISSRNEIDRKLDMVVNTLTDNEYNGKNGWVTRLNTMEKMVMMHDTYWKFLIAICGGTFLIGLIFNAFFK
jgi:chromosome segregation ATPase